MDGLYKVVIIGSESTGKSTLTTALANHFSTTYNPEYAREYLESLGRPYAEADLQIIATAQISEEDRRCNEARKYLFCDTDLYVIKVWSEARYNRCSRKVLEEISKRQYHLYLLTDIDMPWEDDPLREHPSPSDRAYFFNQYKDIVIESGIPFAIVRGPREVRLARAIEVIRTLE